MSDPQNDEVIPSYTLGHVDMQGHRTLTISGERYDRLAKAVEILSQVLRIEEQYDALMRNYRAFELGQADVNLLNVINKHFDTDEFDEHRRSLALALANLLSTARALIDTTPKRLKVIGGRTLVTRWGELKDAVEQRTPAFGFMEVLRNHAQHEGVALTGLTLGVVRGDKDDLRKDDLWDLIHTAEVKIDLEELEKKLKERGFDGSEFCDSRGVVALTPLVRGYVKALNEIMLSTRLLMREKEASAAALNEQALDDLRKVNGSSIAEAAIKRDQHGNCLEEVFLSTLSKDRLASLRRRHGDLQHLSRSKRHS
ncbi:hypothetical protein [uncultured Brevundimonas sp.]|uniref:hypothetical protein n=1 Tax=uncultured Brevundimonas sp. TaxID=213418 RepID=UPI0025DC15D1|nr:hypothetical protein [uncultured Brevundimonas sp.]